MEYIKEIAFYKNRRDEVPNQELASILAENEDINRNRRDSFIFIR